MPGRAAGGNAGRIRHEYGYFCAAVRSQPGLAGRSLAFTRCGPARQQGHCRRVPSHTALPEIRSSATDIEAYVARYLALAERIEVDETALAIPECRDPKDRPFLALALAGRADVLVTGDGDLLSLIQAVPFQIETPAQYAKWF